MGKARQQTEFGDFQTPETLAKEVCELLRADGRSPCAIVEPTCGRGSLLIAALTEFPDVACAHGLEINKGYLDELSAVLRNELKHKDVRLHCADFFATDWPAFLNQLPDPLLVIGNPPWVTNAELGRIESTNLPRKTNYQQRSGLDAVTGKSNFDVSEWMLTHLMKILNRRKGTLAMLCKTAVARKVLHHAWEADMCLKRAAIYEIDALKSFNASVQACLLVCDFDPLHASQSARVYPTIGAPGAVSSIGFRGGHIVADTKAFDESCQLGSDTGKGAYVWRSGIKHDCAPVMELREASGHWTNKRGDLIEIESACVYPMLKSSDVANGRTSAPAHWMLVPQRHVGEDTSTLKSAAPKTWRYLESHAERLDNRRSSIYLNRPRFSVFGVGDYSFAPYKVAISGFYKRTKFEMVGSHRGKPIVFDDTVYFLPCQSPDEATFLASLLNSPQATKFFSGYIFWDAKRPITAEILRKLDLRRLAMQLNLGEEFDEFAFRRGASQSQPTLF